MRSFQNESDETTFVSGSQKHATLLQPFGGGRLAQSWITSMRFFGRSVQMLGLFVPCIAILLQLNWSISLVQMLVMLVGAVCLFLIGRIVEGYARP